MHRTIDAPREKGLLDFLGEKRLAAGLAQETALDFVAARRDRLDRDALRGHIGMGGEQGLAHRTRLPKGERAAATADGKRILHGGSRTCISPARSMASTAMAERPILLGIETSCDETAAAIVTADRRILAHKLASQDAAHAAYGGVVPEIAARAHAERLDGLVAAALAEADLALDEVDAVAATTGPGLIGGVMVGAVTAKALALGAGTPFVAVNHLEGHALSPRLIGETPFPYLLLLVSGGHCQLLVVEEVGGYRRLGSTIDDAAGEAFDKTAKLLGLGYPGGPAIEAWAAHGDPERFSLPRPLLGQPGCNFSFSGLKTAVLRAVEDLEARRGALARRDKADLAAGVQAAIGDCLVDRSRQAIAAELAGETGPAGQLVVAGGVAANGALRRRLTALAENAGLDFVAPPQWLCTDNAAMIAWAGLERFQRGERDGLDTPVRPRWPLDESAPPVYGAGAKGAKA